MCSNFLAWPGHGLKLGRLLASGLAGLLAGWLLACRFRFRLGCLFFQQLPEECATSIASNDCCTLSACSNCTVVVAASAAAAFAIVIAWHDSPGTYCRFHLVHRSFVFHFLFPLLTHFLFSPFPFFPISPFSYWFVVWFIFSHTNVCTYVHICNFIRIWAGTVRPAAKG